jgi:hypothetical protein
MKLIVFPLKHENPFPVKAEKGVPVSIDSDTSILRTGIGIEGVETLGSILSEYPEYTCIIEFGSAANVTESSIGQIYECTTFLGLDGTILGTSGKMTDLPSAGVTGGDSVFTGEEYDWTDRHDMPIIFTMETLKFRNVAKEFRKQFISIRLVTDDGFGDIRKQIVDSLEKSRKKIRKLFETIKEIS